MVNLLRIYHKVSNSLRLVACRMGSLLSRLQVRLLSVRVVRLVVAFLVVRKVVRLEEARRDTIWHRHHLG
jgi:hypothetical protein